MGLKYANADHTTIFDDSRNMHIPCSVGNTQFDEIVMAGTSIADYVAPAATWDSVRAERNQLLKDTDWQASSDYTMSDAQKTYRQALRDLPSTNSDPTKIVFPDAP
jgi:hypothetical protein